MIELLRRAAAAGAPGPAIIGDDCSIGYGPLVELAETACAWLLARGVQRLAVVDPDAVATVALMAGASLAGVELCVYPPADSAEDVLALADRFEHALLISDRTDLSGPVEVVPARSVLTASALAAPSPPVPGRRPLLILTTGTTGTPRGVRQDWSRIVRPFLRVDAAPGQRWLLAYGMHQFGGYQLLLHVLAAAATLVAPAPRRPREGLAAIRAHAVDHVSATPTYWRFLLAELEAGGQPAPELAQITLGGEAVPGPLLAQLRRTFPTARVSQVYAANENGRMRSVGDGASGLPVDALTDDPEADVSLKIVDGELWVRSRIGMLGYHGEPPVDPDAWRPTGDLVEVVGDRVHFHGRTSEVINVGGVKVHPLPVEERISAVPGVTIARVFGRPNPVTGAIVAVDLVCAPGADPAAVEAAVRAACADLPSAARPRRIRVVDTLAVTGDKLTRKVAR